MPSELLSSITGGSGGSAFPFPTLPTPLFNDGFMAADANRIPHNGTLVDNIKLPTTFSAGTGTGAFEGWLGNTQIWSVAPGDINVACDGYWSEQSLWYDSVNDRLWVFALDTATTPDTVYTAYITLETGAVTNIGNATLTAQPNSPTNQGGANVYRPAIDSGNFTIITPDHTIVIDETNGAEVSNTPETNIYGSVQPGTYTTLDGTILVSYLSQVTSSSSGKLHLTKNGNSWTVVAPMPLLGAVSCSPHPWGDKVKISGGISTNNTAGILRTFNRSQFDAWLQEVARFGGVS